MRTLSEITEDALHGKMPSQEECYYTMLVYRAMFISSHTKVLMAIAKGDIPLTKALLEQTTNAFIKAEDVSPKEWLGPNNDPMNSDCQEAMETSRKILNGFLNKKMEGGK